MIDVAEGGVAGSEEEGSSSSSESSGATFDAVIDTINLSAGASFERERLLRTKPSNRSAALDTYRVLLPHTTIPCHT